MRRSTSALIVVLLFLFSCTKESVTPESESGDDYLKRGKAITKTWKIHESSGTMEWDFANERCSPNPQFSIMGTGHSTHLGAFTVKNTTCYGAGDVLHGVMTAANGDQIFTLGWPLLDEFGDPIQIDGYDAYHYDIQEGSGRFKGADGFVVMWGEIDYINMTFDLQGLGEITY